MDCLIAVLTSIAISVMETIGLIMCCRFPDELQTSVAWIPKSLIENMSKLSETVAQIKAISHTTRRDEWLSDVEMVVGEARLLLQPESGSSNNNDDQQMFYCFGYNGRSPSKLHGKVKTLIEEGQRIIASAEAPDYAPGIPSVEEDTTSLQQTVEQTGVVPDIRVGTAKAKTKEQAIEHTAGVPGIGESSTAKESSTSLESHITKEEKMQLETSRRKVVHIDGVPDIKGYRTIRKTASEIMDMLGDNGIRKIGLWGPGGVGKTTLVQTLNNMLENASPGSPNFSLVMLISVTRDVDPKKMQKAIAARLKLTIEEGMDTKEVANQIRCELQREMFLLILDDVWESIDLPSIGIPENQMGYKIVLTTRNLGVCKTMEAEAIKMDYLTEAESWRLFSQQIGHAVDAEGINPLAETACEECGGLPLALVSVGSSMKGELDISRWQNVIEKLQNSIPVNDTISQLYDSLKLSYDSLENDNLKSCFLYCCLYPKSSYIDVRELVECWLAENLIDSKLDYVDAFSKGMELIGKWKNCSLVKVFEGNYWETCTWMNPMVCNAARWIAKSEGKNLAVSGYGISKSPDVILPKKADHLEWISFMGSEKTVPPEHVTYFSYATTVIIEGHDDGDQGAVLEEVLQGFGALRVLNIKKLWGFSSSFIHSNEIRALLLTQSLEEIENLSNLQNLMVIDFSWRGFSKLPSGIEQITCLRVLNLSYTSELRSIDKDVIRKLEQLEVLDMRGSSYKWPTREKDDQSRNATLQDLSSLTCLKGVCVELADVEGSYEEFKWMEKLRSFLFCYGYWKPALLGYQCGEKIICIDDRHSTAEIGSFILHAEKLYLNDCDVNETLLQFFTSKRYSSAKLRSSIAINHSIQLADAMRRTFSKLKSLTIETYSIQYLFSFEEPHIIKLPELEKITVRRCWNFRRIFDRYPTERQATVPNLKELVLEDLPLLQSLSNSKGNYQWTSLETLIVNGCPKLQMLPRMSSIKEIRGSVSWWNNLKWDSEETKLFMKQRFKPRSDPFEEGWY